MSTIFASATAPVKSGVAIIRISGENAFNALAAFGIPATIPPRYAALHKLYTPKTNELIDEALVLWFPAPNSFTGEDTIEFQTHGSRAVINEIIEQLSHLANFRLAEPGEFSKRAFNNGKMDLTQADGLADLIDAETKAQKRQALRQMQGELEQLYEGWRSQLIETQAFFEAYIDFPEEDIPANILGQVEGKIDNLKSAIRTHLDDKRRGEKLRDGLHAVIIGSPNAGKSSLLNHLARRDVAIVSNIAGTTRDTIEVQMDVGGYPFTLVDTAGLRESEDIIESEGIRRAREHAANADLTIALFDATALPDIDKETTTLLNDDSIVCITKSDLTDDINIPEALTPYSPIAISTTAKTGTDTLIDLLGKRASDFFAESENPAITQARYRDALIKSLDALERLSIHTELELTAEDLRLAAQHIGRITGRIDVEDILDSLFSNFCIGK